MVSPENHATVGETDRVHCKPNLTGANCASQEIAMSAKLFRPSNSPRTATAAAPTSVYALTARVLAAQTRGALAQRAREVVLENQAKATSPAA